MPVDSGRQLWRGKAAGLSLRMFIKPNLKTLWAKRGWVFQEGSVAGLDHCPLTTLEGISPPLWFSPGAQGQHQGLLTHPLT